MSNLFDIARNVTVLSSKQQRALVPFAQMGETPAVEALVESNVRLAISVARKNQRSGILLDDLAAIAVGSILDSIRTYDMDKGRAFSTHARQRMVADVQAHIRACSPATGDTRIKRAVFGRIFKLQRQFTLDGTPMTPANVARAMGCSEEDAREAMALVNPNPKSLSAPVGDDNGATFGDTLVSRTLRQDEALDRTRLAERVHVALASFCEALSLRDLHIVRGRIMADMLGNEPVGQLEIAEENGISKQRVGQIEKKLRLDLLTHFKDNGVAPR